MWRAGSVFAWIVTCLLIVGSVALAVGILISGAWIVAGVALSLITVAFGTAVMTGLCGRRLWRQGAR
jgi:hypothetical protein